MNRLKLVLIFSIILLCIHVHSQTACVEELAKIYEPDFSNIRIEPSGRLSYINEKSIFTSEDEGLTWNETPTPFDLRQGTGTAQVTTYKALENEYYILHTRSTMHYKENNEWKLFEVNGDSLFRDYPFIIEDKVFVIQDSKLYSYNDNTKEIKFEIQLTEYNWPDVDQFKNHFVIHVGS